MAQGKGLSIFGRRFPCDLFKGPVEVGRMVESEAAGDLQNGAVGGLQIFYGLFDALNRDIIPGGDSV